MPKDPPNDPLGDAAVFIVLVVLIFSVGVGVALGVGYFLNNILS